MNARHRWWLAGALLCVSAAGAHRARANEAALAAAATATATATAPSATMPATIVAARVLLGPLRLVRPLDPETIGRAVQEADSLYLGLKAGEAQAAFAAVVELDPLNAFAWLRLGNLHQQAGRDGEALDAYGRASAAPPASAAAAEARGKALLNIALLSVARAGRAMDEFDAMNAVALEAGREEVARQVAEQRLRTDRAMAPRLDPAARSQPPVAVRMAATPAHPGSGSAMPQASQPAGPSGQSQSPRAPAAPRTSHAAASPGPSDAFEPYTVDRWIATPRRPAARPVQARSAVTEPLSQSPLPPAPAIESITGGARHGALR